MEAYQGYNPLREGLRQTVTVEPCTVVIFGASGDLTRRKLFPALYRLARQNLLPHGFTIVGTGRTPLQDTSFREHVLQEGQRLANGIGDDSLLWKNFAQGIYYVVTDAAYPESYQGLRRLLERLAVERGTGHNHLFYLATPPSQYIPILHGLAAAGLTSGKGTGWTRVIVEKPFGLDAASARQINREALQVLQEEQIYRIDHYLGKETVQNIMALRFANGIFEPLWNNRYIDHVQITAAEDIGVENRGEYYEQAGALRDMIQNHMIQLLSLVAMEPPVALTTVPIRDEKVKVLQAVRRWDEAALARHTVRAQYAAGEWKGRPVRSYREEPKVFPGSMTETYAALTLHIDNWRWANVPFYLRTGKYLPKRLTEIAIQFKDAPHRLFPGTVGQSMAANTLVLRIQPEEGISMSFNAKSPGQFLAIRPVTMDFQYWTSFGERPPEAYERLILDAMAGDSTHFARGDMVEAAWEILDPILAAWQQPDGKMPFYQPGSWGPVEAAWMLQQSGRQWRQP